MSGVADTTVIFCIQRINNLIEVESDPLKHPCLSRDSTPVSIVQQPTSWPLDKQVGFWCKKKRVGLSFQVGRYISKIRKLKFHIKILKYKMVSFNIKTEISGLFYPLKVYSLLKYSLKLNIFYHWVSIGYF